MSPGHPSSNGHAGVPRASHSESSTAPDPRFRIHLFTLLAPFVMLTWVFAFAPEPQVLATIPGVLALLWWVEHVRRARTALWGLLLFVGLGIAYGYRWLSQTVQDFGGLSEAAGISATVAFSLAGTVHLLLFAGIHRGMVRSREARGAKRPHPLSTVALFVACECLPIRFFPWMAGHGAVDCVPIAQAAAWGGVPAVSFVLLCLVVPLYEWGLAAGCVHIEARETPTPGLSPARPGAALATFLIGLLCYGYGVYDARTVRVGDAAATKHVHVGVVQANIGSFSKRHSEQYRAKAHEASVAAYARGVQTVAKEDVDLIVLPETAVGHAIPFDASKRTPKIVSSVLSHPRVGFKFLMEHSVKHGLLIGSYEAVPRSRRAGPIIGKKPDRRYNVAALRARGANDQPWSVYRKHYLIPFGETMPFGIMKDKLPQKFDMRAGSDDQGALTFEGTSIVPFLCYEGLLANYVRRLCKGERPDILVSLTNDSWFGDTWEPHQHLNFTRFRAIEHRSPMVRSTNTGVSAFVSATGAVEARLGVGKEGTLVRSVPIVDREPTLFLRFGHIVPWLFALIWFLGLCGLMPGDRS